MVNHGQKDKKSKKKKNKINESCGMNWDQAPKKTLNETRSGGLSYK